MTAAAVCGGLAGGCGLAGYVPYGRKLARGWADPSRLAWLLWSLPPVVLLVSLAAGPAPRATLPLPAAQAAATWATAALVLRYGHGSLRTRRAAAALGAAAVALVVWWHWHVRDPAISLLIALAIEEAGMALTIARAWRRPAGTVPLMWALQAAAGLLALAAAGSSAAAVVYLYLAAFTASAVAVLAAGWLGPRRQRHRAARPAGPARRMTWLAAAAPFAIGFRGRGRGR